MAENIDILIRHAVEGAGKITDAAKRIRELGGDSADTERAAEQLSAELSELANQRGNIQAFGAVKQAIAGTEAELAEAQQTAQRLGRELANTEKPTAKLTREFSRARSTVRDYQQQLGQQRRRLQELRGDLGAAGIATTDLAAAQQRIASSSRNAQQRLDGLQRSADATERELRQAAEANKQLRADFDKLGVKPFKDVQAEVQQVRGALERLRNSSQVSSREFAKAQVNARDQIASLQRGTNGVTEALGRSRGAITAAGAALVGLTFTAGRAVGSYRELEASLAEVNTLLDDPSAIDGIAESVRKLAAQFGTQQREQAQAFYQTISAGFGDSAEAAKVLEASNTLAVGGLTSTRTAVDGITSVLNAYTLGAEQSARVSDIFFATVKQGKTTVDEFAGSVGRVAPLAAQTGVSFEQLGAGVATLTAGGVATAEAITQLRGILAAVVKPTAEAQQTAAKLGLEFNTSALRAKGLAGFLEDVIEATGGNEQAIATLFGRVEALNGVLGLTGDQADRFARNLDATANSAGNAAEALAKVQATDDQRLKRFTASFEALKISIGGTVTQAILPATDALTELFNAIADAPEAVQLLVGALTVGLPAIGATTVAFAASAKALRLLGAAAAGVSFSSLISGVDSAGGAMARTTAAAGLFAKALRFTSIVGVATTVLAPIAVQAAKIAAGFSDAARSAEDAQAKLAAQLNDEVAGLQLRTAELERFRGVQALNAQLAGELGEQARAEYAAQLAGARELAAAELGIALRRQQLAEQQQQDTTALDAQLAALTRRLADLRRAQADLNTEVQAAAPAQTAQGEAAAKAIDTATAAVKRLQGAAEAAGDTIKALTDADLAAQGEALAKGLKAATDEVDRLNAALPELAGQGGDAMRAFLAELETAEQQAKTFGAALDDVAGEALRRLGVDAVQATTGLSAGFRKAEGALQVVLKRFGDTPRVVEASIAAFVDTAKSIEEIEAAENILAEARRNGTLSAEAAKRAEAELTAARIDLDIATTNLTQGEIDLAAAFDARIAAEVAAAEQAAKTRASNQDTKATADDLARSVENVGDAADNTAQRTVSASATLQGAIAAARAAYVDLGDEAVRSFDRIIERTFTYGQTVSTAIRLANQQLRFLQAELDRQAQRAEDRAANAERLADLRRRQGDTSPGVRGLGPGERRGRRSASTSNDDRTPASGVRSDIAAGLRDAFESMRQVSVTLPGGRRVSGLFEADAAEQLVAALEAGAARNPGGIG